MFVRASTAIVVAALVSGVAFADARDDYNRRNAERFESLFRMADANTDGVVTREEAVGAVDLQARFDDIDVGRDGAITRDELTRFVEATFR